MADVKLPFVPEIFKGPGRVFVPDWAGADVRGRSPALQENGLSSEGKTLILKGARCILPGQGIVPLEIKIHGSRIAALADHFPDTGEESLELGGRYVAPGLVDPHVHLGIFAPLDTEIITETRSALMHGVTTIGLYLVERESYLPQLDRILRRIEETSHCDVFLHLAILTPEQLKEIPLYHARYGITSFKTYMCGIPGMIPQVEDDFLADVMEAVADLGTGAVLNIHAENHRIVSRALARERRQEPDPATLEAWERSHPAIAEVEAIQRAVTLSQQSGVQIYFVHLSALESAEAATEIKARHRNVFFETTSPYLTVALEEHPGVLYKMTPPIRYRRDQDALWSALASGAIDTIGTDHTPMSFKEKTASANLWEVPPGYPALGTHLPSLLHAARERGFSLAQLVEKLTAAPAKLFGLYPRKGSLLPGADADLVILDMQLERQVMPEAMGSRADYCLHQGKHLCGWPVGVIQGGRYWEWQEGVLPPPRGRYLPRGG